MRLTCSQCKKTITGAKTVIEEMYWCPRCTYAHDFPDREIVETRRPRAKLLQKETLFALGPKAGKRKGNRVPDLD